MKIITIAHQKGGVGKTTLALNLAYCLAEDLRVAISDTDLQGSISDIEQFIKGIDLIPLKTVQNGKKLPYDVLIIDTPPYLTSKLNELFLLSDFVLVPTKAGYLDALAIKATITLINQAKVQKPQLNAAIVLNMLMPRTTLNEDVKEILKSYDLPLLKSSISQRVSFARSPITQSIFSSEDEKAKEEIINLANEVIQIMNQ